MWLAPEEVGPFEERAALLGAPLRLTRVADGAEVRFLEHEGERCPMLDPSTWRCRAYQGRPRACREFPDRPREGCALSLRWTSRHGPASTA